MCVARWLTSRDLSYHVIQFRSSELPEIPVPNEPLKYNMDTPTPYSIPQQCLTSTGNPQSLSKNVIHSLFHSSSLQLTVPALVLGNAIMTAPGQLHEMEHAVIDNRVYRVYKNLWPSIRVFWTLTVSQNTEIHNNEYLVFEDTRMTYGEADAMVQRMASLLREVGSTHPVLDGTS